MHRGAAVSLTADLNVGGTPTPDAAPLNDDAGDHTRFVREYQELVVNTCYHFVLDIDDAHDVAQEVFLAALRLAPRITSDSEWRAWLYRAATHRSLNALRARKRRSWLRSFWSARTTNEQPENIAASDHTRPDRAFENAELEKALDAAIAGLPRRQRIAFTLHRREGLANSEIAAILRIGTNAVDALLHRARAHLRKRLIKRYQEFLDQ